jgi:rod shape-determining protein MreD
MHKTIAIFCSICVAVLLTLVPLPEHIAWFRPVFVLLTLIYWSLTITYRNELLTAWCTGFFIDLLTGSLLGEHAFALTVISYCVAKLHLRLRMFPLTQQAISVLLFVLFYQLILFCIQGFQGEPLDSYKYWLASLTSMMIWPFFYIVMQNYRERFKVV